MEQQKLFYNICNDLWAFAKTLDKKKSDMTDEDWSKAMLLIENTTSKYKNLGEKEYDLITSTMWKFMDYVEKAEQI